MVLFLFISLSAAQPCLRLPRPGIPGVGQSLRFSFTTKSVFFPLLEWSCPPPLGSLEEALQGNEQIRLARIWTVAEIFVCGLYVAKPTQKWHAYAHSAHTHTPTDVSNAATAGNAAFLPTAHCTIHITPDTTSHVSRIKNASSAKQPGPDTGPSLQGSLCSPPLLPTLKPPVGEATCPSPGRGATGNAPSLPTPQGIQSRGSHPASPPG